MQKLTPILGGREMPRNLHYYRKECENLLAAISDEETKDSYEVAMENSWNDQVSLEEISLDLRNEILMEKMF
jgi:hypothetical protein